MSTIESPDGEPESSGWKSPAQDDAGDAVVNYPRSCLLAVLGMSYAAPVSGSDLPMPEYEAAVSRYLTSLDNISFEFTDVDRARDGSTLTRTDNWVVSIPGHIRVKSVRQVTRQGVPDAPRTEWTLLRPDGCYSISQNEGDQYVLKEWQREVVSPLMVEAGSPIQIPMLPVCRGNYSLIRLIRSQVKGHTVRVFDFRQLGPDPVGAAFRSEDLINGGVVETQYEADSDWLFRRYKMVTKANGHGVSFEFAYTTFDGRRLPERIAAKLVDAAGGTRPGFEAEFRNYQFYPVQPADFSLTQFGLPESLNYQAPPGPSSRRWRYFVAAALLFAVLAVGFRYLARRRAAPAST